MSVVAVIAAPKRAVNDPDPTSSARRIKLLNEVHASSFCCSALSTVAT
jgi:hypothetical protein